MEGSEMRIVEVPTMRVARFHGYGATPEGIAFGKMQQWLESHGMSAEKPPCRIFGFNNPSPESGSPNYGYEFWLELPSGSTLEATAESAALRNEVEIRKFDGGRYAAMRHEGGGETIPKTWKRLVAQVAESGHEHSHHQWLEEHFPASGTESGELSLDCLDPIR